MNASRQAVALNTVGVIMLLLGFSGVILLYRQDRPSTSNPNSDWKDGTLSLTDSKTNTQNIELYGGKLEVLMLICGEWFRHPESQAILIATISVLAALACFLVAGRQSGKR